MTVKTPVTTPSDPFVGACKRRFARVPESVGFRTPAMSLAVSSA
jgi:hypothetical protein